MSNPDVMIVSVRHVPADKIRQVLDDWDKEKQGYIFSIESNNKDLANEILNYYLGIKHGF